MLHCNGAAKSLFSVVVNRKAGSRTFFQLAAKSEKQREDVLACCKGAKTAERVFSSCYKEQKFNKKMFFNPLQRGRQLKNPLSGLRKAEKGKSLVKAIVRIERGKCYFRLFARSEKRKGARRHSRIRAEGQEFRLQNVIESGKEGKKALRNSRSRANGQGFHLQNAVKSAQEKGKDAVA